MHENSFPDQLTQLSYAINMCYDQSEGANKHSVKEQAVEFCESIRRDENGWKISLVLFLTPGADEQSKFFALSALQTTLSGAYFSNVPPNVRLEIRTGLLQWILDPGTSIDFEASYMRTKLALVLALCLKHDYPNAWPNAFDDLLQLASPQQSSNIDLVLKILIAIDEEIVAFHVDRQADEVARNMSIKDAMRERGSVRDICTFINHVIQTNMILDSENPELAVLALNTFQRYIGWIEVSYVVNEMFLSLLRDCIRNLVLSEAALGCLVEVVNKGMPDGNKLELLHHLKIPALLGALPLDCDDDTAEEAADVANSVGTHLLSNWERLEGVMVQAGTSSSNMGETLFAASITANMLRENMDILMYYLSHRTVDVSSTVVPLALLLLDTARTQISQGRNLETYEGIDQNGEPYVLRPFVAMDYVSRLLVVIFEQLHYSEDYDFSEAEEEDTEEEVHRRNIRKLYLKTVKTCPELALQYMCSLLTEVLTLPLTSLPFHRVEALLRLVYHFGEGLGPKNQTLVEQGQFPAVLTAIHATDVATHSHWCVVTLYLECAERYWKHLRKDPQAIGLVLERMCGCLSHSNGTLRARSSFLLKSLIKHLGPTLMTSFTPTVLAGLQDLIFSGRLSDNDIGAFFELSSLLLCNGTLDESSQLSHFNALVSPVMISIQTLLESSALQTDPATTGDALALKLNFLAMSSKGSLRPVSHLQGPYEQIFRISIDCFATLPQHNGLRSRFMVVVHRMVICLEGNCFLQFVPDVIPLLVASWKQADSDDFENHVDILVPFLDQLMIRFEEKLLDIMDQWLLPILHQICSILPNLQADNATHANAQSGSLQRHYFVLLHHAVGHNLTNVLCSPRNSQHLEGVLMMLVYGIENHNDPVIKKLCIGIVRLLMKIWLIESSPIDVSSFVNYLMEKIVPTSISCLLSSQFKLKDANSVRVIGEVAKLLLELFQAFGTQFKTQLGDVILPQLNFPVDLAHSFSSSFDESSTEKSIEKSLKQIISLQQL